MYNWRRYAYILYTFSKGVLCTFPALSFYCTQLLNQSITCLTALIYDSIFLKLRCITLIYLLRVFIILMVCSWPFKKILMSCVLFKGCNNSPVSTPAIPSTKVLQVWKNIKLEFTFSHQSSDKNASALNQSVTWNVDWCILWLFITILCTFAY